MVEKEMSSHTFARKASKKQFEESECRKAESESRIAAWQAETLKALNDQLQEVPVRVQRKRSKGWKMPDNTVYVGRPTIFGNRFELWRFDTRENCLKAYESDLLFAADSDRMLQMIMDKLRGHNLACWCRLDQPCHADILLRLANS